MIDDQFAVHDFFEELIGTWAVFTGFFQIVFWIPALLFGHHPMGLRHVLFQGGVTMTPVIPAVQGNPLVIMIDLHCVFAIGNSDLLADIAERDAVKVPVFTDDHMIVLLDFGFGVVPYPVG
ncbi:hypothetical protein D3C87_1417520 [compost metagenome]